MNVSVHAVLLLGAVDQFSVFDYRVHQLRRRRKGPPKRKEKRKVSFMDRISKSSSVTSVMFPHTISSLSIISESLAHLQGN